MWEAKSDMNNKLEDANSVTCRAQIYVRSEPGGSLLPGRQFLISALRPGWLRISAVARPNEPGPYVVSMFDTVICNGQELLEIDSILKCYSLKRTPCSLTTIQLVNGLFMKLGGDVIFNVPVTAGFCLTNPNEAESGTVYERQRKDDMPSRIDRLSIDASGLPTTYSIFIIENLSSRCYEHIRVDYSEWKLNENLTPEMFEVLPPEGYSATQDDHLHAIPGEFAQPFRIYTGWTPDRRDE